MQISLPEIFKPGKTASKYLVKAINYSCAYLHQMKHKMALEAVIFSPHFLRGISHLCMRFRGNVPLNLYRNRDLVVSLQTLGSRAVTTGSL